MGAKMSRAEALAATMRSRTDAELRALAEPPSVNPFISQEVREAVTVEQARRERKAVAPFVDVQHEHHADGVTLTLSRVIRVF
jgi:RecJ-like exonuclease